MLSSKEMEPSSFGNDDRKALYEQGARLEMLMSSFNDLRKELREAGAPSAEEFGRLEGKVESLQNFRWYLMGAAAVVGLLAHILLSKIGI